MYNNDDYNNSNNNDDDNDILRKIDGDCKDDEDQGGQCFNETQ